MCSSDLLWGRVSRKTTPGAWHYTFLETGGAVEPSAQCDTETTEMSGALPVPESSVQFGEDLTPTTTSPATKRKGKDPEVVDVQVRFTIKERLERFEFASKVGLKAHKSGDFSEEEVRQLRRFQEKYNARRLEWFSGKRGPTVAFHLVALKRITAKGASDGIGSASDSAVTGIRIVGLPSENDIRQFHKAMSIIFANHC